jgi:hypothetical protein
MAPVMDSPKCDDGWNEVGYDVVYPAIAANKGNVRTVRFTMGLTRISMAPPL